MARYCTNFSSSTAAVAVTARTKFSSASAAHQQRKQQHAAVVAAVHIHVDRISVGFGGVPPRAVSAPDLDVGAWAWVQT